ncbi:MULTISPECIES: sigma-54-dependent transcriptional regulator [unclassified Arsukibacterium]|uniref:sigma-54-dependent transcriptional regulator n=1 Tax=unclassified Arsukibacterium TaxID=2635278 RepID=UPI000C3E7A98|nr:MULTISPECIES: sigma-54 dependent transcriptional regulator [unclassified Arsukibacterium]MAA93119.1 sigma-54-dependent Fis family transcriptional regulator [Rheinheimera sp.]MBM33943.1 sigma-54-dependent Fis family transcriptional regulator [Rheinheimera sp.]|tara:strand:- start:10341 stop:11666 length:1326 start_codon:yes stop_codon:yes gene_type:complete
MLKILVIDDNQPICQALQTLFSLQGYQVFCASEPALAWQKLASNDIDLVLQDMNFSAGEMHGDQGKTLFYQLRQHYPDLPIVLMTAWTQLDMVVELVKAGATDYIAKPWDDQRLLLTVANALKLKQLAVQQQRLERERQAAFAGKELCNMVFASSKMQQLLQMTLQLAPANAAVLITGPNGAGKEGIANVLHANSPRKNKPFIKVNMGALPGDLMEAELFGAEAGAYSGASKTRIGRFEAADGGTLFLDEIGNLSLAGQAKLLRVLQTGEFERLGSSQTRHTDVRVISATNSDLTAAISRGEFRQDLYYRVNVVQLQIPALCERPEDIPVLARYFLAGKKTLSRAAGQQLQSYSWPGNVRELQNVCQRALLLSSNAEIQADELGLPDNPITAKRSLDDIDRLQLEQALLQAGGVVSRAAKQLGISRQALYRRMEFYGIATP